jgi:hypothetical protein
VADIRRGIGADNRVERLPWLEAVEDEGDFGGGTRRRWAVIGLAGLGLAALLVVGAVVTLRWHAAHADIGGIIRAPAGPYKVKPAQAGGLASATADQVAEQTGTGADVDAPLALVGQEQPVVGPGAQAAAAEAGPAQPRPAPTARAAIVLPNPKPVAVPPATGTTPAPAPTPATDGGTVQLGAFGSEAKAKAAWKNLSKRFAYLAAMNVGILPAEVNGATVYRLRASGGEPAARICARLELAGEACAVIG